MKGAHRLIFVTGATATGKSDWALRVAQESKAKIINCDSVQVYSGLEIGSAQPSAEEKASAPHFLYGHVAFPEEMTAGRYREEVFALLESWIEPQRVFIVGGTGFYFQALEKGMFDSPAVPLELQKELSQLAETAEGREALWRELEAQDPAEARRLSPQDRYRLSRAVELLRTGVRPSELKAKFQTAEFPYPLLKTGVQWDKEGLFRRIERRTRKMIQAGLVEETQAALQQGWGPWAPLASVGYKQAVSVLRGELERDKLEDEICLRTRQLTKRQKTWFQRDQEIENFSGESDFEKFRQRCLRFFEAPTILGAP